MSRNASMVIFIRFLFDLYDFNEFNVISKDDIEFILISVINATYKIYNINETCNEEEIL